MIKFTKIKYSNFMSTGQRPVEILLDKAPKTLSVGVNGSGKSIFLDALTFALFGKPFRDIPKPLLVNTMNDCALEVEIEFTKGSNEYLVRRGIKPNLFEIFVNGKMLDLNSNVREQQKAFEEDILQMDYKAFTQIVILGSKAYIPFMKLTSAQRREFVENLLDIDVFSSMNKILKEKMQDLTIEMNEIDKEKVKLTERALAQKKVIETITEQNKVNLEGIQTRYDAKVKQIKDLETEYEKFPDDLQRNLQETLDIQEDYKENLRKYEESKRQLTEKVFELDREIKFLKHTEVCQSCGQNISQDFKDRRMAECEEQIKKANKALEVDEEGIKACNNSIYGLQGCVDKYQKQIDDRNDLLKDIMRLKDEAEEIAKEYKASRNQEKDDLTEEKKILKQVALRLKDIEKSRKELLEKEDLYRTTIPLLKDSGIKTYIVKRYIPIINQYINYYLHKLDFNVEFYFDEQFNETFTSRFRDTYKYGSFSDGERMRIDLAVLFAWRKLAKERNSVNTNLLILDEIFDSSLDYAGVENFMQIIDHLTDGTNAYIISHKVDILEDQFEHILKFTKESGFTEIKQEI